MKFVIEKDDLQKVLTIASDVITSNIPFSILSNVFLRAKDDFLTIKASDTMINFTAKINADVEEEGETTVYASKFISALQKMPSGEILFEEKDNKASLLGLSGKIRTNIKGLSSEKYLAFPKCEDSEYFSLHENEFKRMIDQTLFAASSEKERFFLTGVFCTKKDEKFISVSTDAHRLAYMEQPFVNKMPEAVEDSIIPTRFLRTAAKVLSTGGEIDVCIKDKVMFLRSANYEFSCKLIDGKFPDYTKVIPKNTPNSILVKREEILGALNRAEVMVDKHLRRVIFTLKKEKDGSSLIISTPESELGDFKEELSVISDADEVKIGFDYQFVIEPIKVIESEDVEFCFSEPNRAILLRGKPKDKETPSLPYFHIIMPMMLSN